MGYAIEDIEGVGEVYGQKLKSANVETVDARISEVAACVEDTAF